jgi:AraC family L-rhamnose operon regulatory protein RhaS
LFASAKKLNEFDLRMRADHTITQDYVRLSNRRPVRAEPVPKQPDYSPHDHEFYEISLITGGRARHVTVDGEEPLTRGSVVIVAPGQLHSYAGTKGFSVVNVYYIAEWFLANMQALQGIDRLVPLFFQRALFPSADRGGVVQLKLTEAELADCLHDFEELQRESEERDGHVLFLEASFLKCLIRLARAYARDERSGYALDWPAAVVRGLAVIERIVRSGDAPDIEAVAREAGVSFSHFCRLFKTTTGLTAGDYFQRRRIHRACHRLLTTDATATEIGHQLGFADSAHFNRRFKETTGLTPRDYRRKFAAG